MLSIIVFLALIGLLFALALYNVYLMQTRDAFQIESQHFRNLLNDRDMQIQELNEQLANKTLRCELVEKDLAQMRTRLDGLNQVEAQKREGWNRFNHLTEAVYKHLDGDELTGVAGCLNGDKLREIVGDNRPRPRQPEYWDNPAILQGRIMLLEKELVVARKSLWCRAMDTDRFIKPRKKISDEQQPPSNGQS